MPMWKHSYFLSAQTNPDGLSEGEHVDGGSEHLFKLGVGPDVNGFDNVMTERANTLPVGCKIIGQRYQQISELTGLSSGPSKQGKVIYPGTTILKFVVDIPKMCLNLRATGNTGNVRKFTMRCFPDQMVVGGEYRKDAQFTGLLSNYFLALSGWQFKALKLDAPQAGIVSIDNAGVFVLDTALASIPPGYMTILRTNLASGRQKGGKFRVTMAAGNMGGTISGWTFGPATGGRMRQWALVFPTIDYTKIEVGDASTRNMGRPINSHRGRRSRRK